MDEITRAATIAFVGLISALLTQILLRWDHARREAKLRLMRELSNEQSLHERIAYRARQLILKGMPKGDIQKNLALISVLREVPKEGTRKKHARIDKCLFGEVYEKSNHVTLCAELESFGVLARDYSKKVHLFREKCSQTARDALITDCSVEREKAVGKIKNEIKELSQETKDLTRRIHDRFSWI